MFNKYAMTTFLFLIIIILIIIIAILLYCLQNEKNDKTENIVQKVQNVMPVNPETDPNYMKTHVDFQQLGTLISEDSDNPIILPLFGKRKYRDRWTYYTISNTDKNLRIEIEFERRSCMKDRIGCDMIYDGSYVSIPAYNNKPFKVSLYDYAHSLY